MELTNKVFALAYNFRSQVILFHLERFNLSSNISQRIRRVNIA
jgi:hypothetical protein